LLKQEMAQEIEKLSAIYGTKEQLNLCQTKLEVQTKSATKN